MRDRNTIACFGEALIDFLARPGADADSPRHFVEYAGGAPANVAVGVARLGSRSRFIGMLGQDLFGDFLLTEFMRYGVDTKQVRRTDQARTALAFVSLADDGERSFAFYRPPSADLLFDAGDFAEDAFDDVAILHACSNSMTGAAAANATLLGMQRAVRAGALVSFDMNLRPALWPAGSDPKPLLWQALAHAHVVKLSREELHYLSDGTSEARVLERLFAGATQALVVTDGANPIRWWARTTHGTIATMQVAPIDTTAAGDAFVAGLLHGLRQRNLGPDGLPAAFEDSTTRNELLRFAAACGAIATTRNGAFAAMPSGDDVRGLLQAQAMEPNR